MASQTQKKLFGTDGIRGVAGRDLTPDLVVRIGQAVGLWLKSQGNKRPFVIVGKDTRLSGYTIEDALVAGLLSTGADVLQVGPIPTPGLARLTVSMQRDLGIMITASHNTFEYNGIKLFGPDGYKLNDEVESLIEQLIWSDMTSRLVNGRDMGRAKRVDDALGRYIEAVEGSAPKGFKLKGMRVVVDCANGAAYKVAPEVFRELGADLINIGVDPDGTNINENCGSTHLQTIIDEVRKYRADVGVALDGDADRVLLVDEKGNVIDGDQMLAAIATDWKKGGRFTKPLVVGTVMANLGLERYLATQGISLIRASVGDRYVLEEMRKNGAMLGGEPSGHIILAEHSTTGDGLMAALQVLAVARKSHSPVSEALRLFEPVPQILRNARYSGNDDPLERPSVKRAIKEAEAKLGTESRLLVRRSGTEPLIRVMAEGDDRGEIEAVVESIIRSLD